MKSLSRLNPFLRIASLVNNKMFTVIGVILNLKKEVVIKIEIISYNAFVLFTSNLFNRVQSTSKEIAEINSQ